MSKVYKWTDMQTETDDGQHELSAQVSEKVAPFKKMMYKVHVKNHHLHHKICYCFKIVEHVLVHLKKNLLYPVLASPILTRHTTWVSCILILM